MTHKEWHGKTGPWVQHHVQNTGMLARQLNKSRPIKDLQFRARSNGT